MLKKELVMLMVGLPAFEWTTLETAKVARASWSESLWLLGCLLALVRVDLEAGVVGQQCKNTQVRRTPRAEWLLLELRLACAWLSVGSRA
jgi:hypothetical protein